MIGSNGKKIASKKIKNKPGGDCNESRFWTTDRELRAKKQILVPGFGGDCHLIMEQGFNKFAKRKDIVRITLFKRCKKIGYIHVEREDIEQGISLMAQGDEILKYLAPTPYENDLKNLENKAKTIE